MPIRLCLEPRCGSEQVYRGRCADHARVRERTTHPNKHIYGTKRWVMARRHKLSRDPLCEECGRIASDVHHRVDLGAGGDPWAMENLEALCHACHSRVTNQRMRTHSGKESP